MTDTFHEDLGCVGNGFHLHVVQQLSLLFTFYICKNKPYDQGIRLECEVFRDTENKDKSQKLRTKQKIEENTFFATKKQKYPRKSLFLEYF